MPLLGKAAMLLSFDVVEDAIPEHDDWHTHEHLPERLSIPGFIRGTRWVSLDGKPRYFVMYEVDQLATLQSEAYFERLNNPSPWTSKMMPNYRGMIRGLCSVSSSLGAGLGQIGLLIRFKPQTGMESSLRAWLINDTLPRLPSRRGLGSAHPNPGRAQDHGNRSEHDDEPGVAQPVVDPASAEHGVLHFDDERVVGALEGFVPVGERDLQQRST